MNVSDNAVTPELRRHLVESLAVVVSERYVFPQVGEQMALHIRQRLANGAYAQHTHATGFCEVLTADLQAISHDKHIRVMWEYESDHGSVFSDSLDDFRDEINLDMGGVHRVELLPGNIGYLDLRMFYSPSIAGEAVAAAMTVLANTSAVIIDLRQNGGGEPAMVALVTSYLYTGERIHLNDLYYREGNSTTQFWTSSYVPGKRVGNVPVYILISGWTFSAAEEFANNLKELKRATIVGETSGGGANPGGFFALIENYRMFLPTGRAVNPITGTNWEGIGVTPDIAVPQERALETSYLAALREVVALGGDDATPLQQKKAKLALGALAAKEKATKGESS